LTVNLDKVDVVKQTPTQATALNGEVQTTHLPLIHLSGLSKAYSEAGQSRVVLDGLNSEFYAGEFVCLLGKSGSGKSTLLNLISGIDTPSSGRVLIRRGEQAFALTALSEHERTLFRRRHIGIVFQFFNLIPTLTVVENVTLPLELAGPRGRPVRNLRSHAAMLLERVGLGDRLDAHPDLLSGGEQQRVAIARALVHDPLLVLADEPTGNLDDDTGGAVLRLLLELTRDAGKTLIMATHAAEVAQRADRVLHLVHGKLVQDKLQEP
jgi:putative ABC transport system ATP-binding protein